MICRIAAYATLGAFTKLPLPRSENTLFESLSGKEGDVEGDRIVPRAKTDLLAMMRRNVHATASRDRLPALHSGTRFGSTKSLNSREPFSSRSPRWDTAQAVIDDSQHKHHDIAG